MFVVVVVVVIFFFVVVFKNMCFVTLEVSP
jgi:hypothetical protein